MAAPRMLLLLGLISGCSLWKSSWVSSADLDIDGDGFSFEEDCDDEDNTIYPRADELCDGVDNNCDDVIDEGSATDGSTWYIDSDGDGYGNASYTVVQCAQPTGYVENDEDCDDTYAEALPGGTEICDEYDNDCDGTVDNEDAVDALTWYIDADGDEHGDATTSQTACEQPERYVSTGDDCDDTSALASPDSDEVCDDIDNDCDGEIDVDATDAVSWYRDEDGDSYGWAEDMRVQCDQPEGYVQDNTDCDDSDAALRPDTIGYLDADGDGFGDPDRSLTGCDMSGDYVLDNTDCDDSDGDINPSTAWYLDVDGDGYGSADFSEIQCEQPTSYVANSDDCDDLDASLNPDTVWYVDADVDGYGWTDTALVQCEAPDGYVTDNTDCDDTNAALNPDTVWYLDTDHDGYGGETVSVTRCDPPPFGTSDNSDCDDRDDEVNPAATELCDNVDNDCDDEKDEDDAADAVTWYIDVDEDGFGCSDCSADETVACEAPEGSVEDNTDCDDTDELTYPGAAETCDDDVVNDCDGDATRATNECIGGSLTYADAVLAGEALDDYAGISVSGAGDVNGDGLDDLLVGASKVDNGTTTDIGAAYLVLGPVSSMSLAGADAKLTGVLAKDSAGNAVAGVGDLDGDGYDDLLIGDSREDTVGTDAGACYLVLGPVSGALSLADADAKLTSEVRYQQVGYSVSGVGDRAGAGPTSLLIGAPFGLTTIDAGAAYLVSGPSVSGGSLSGAEAKLTGETDGDYAGYAVSDAGDVDGDGEHDLLIGAWDAGSGGTPTSGSGAAYLVLGPVSGTRSLSAADAKFTGASTSDHAGAATSGVGDPNGDGYDDLLVGAPFVGTEAGAAYLFLGPVTGTLSVSEADTTLSGEADGDAAGCSVAGAGDINGDAVDDLLIGANQEDTGVGDTGAAYLLLGPAPSGSMSLGDAEAKFSGAAANEFAGGSVSGAGDVDGDAYGDLLIGASRARSGGEYEGAAYLVLGTTY